MEAELPKSSNIPVEVSIEDMQNPFSIIDDFFSADNVPGHKNELKKWRDFVTGEGYYLNAKGNPSGLLFTYEQNMKLIEAAYRLAPVCHNHPLRSSTAANLLMLDNDKRSWPYYPVDFTEQQALNPLFVIAEIFKFYSVKDYREILYDWLTCALSIKPAGEFIETKDIIDVYENLLKLYDATWLLHVRNKVAGDKVAGDDLSGGNVADENISGDNVAGYSPEVSLYDLDLDADNAVITGIVTIVKNKLETTCMTLYLGRQPFPGGISFFLVLTTDSESREASHLNAMLEESCQPHNVCMLVHYAKSALIASSENNPFFRKMLKHPLVFLSGDCLLLNKQRHFDVTAERDYHAHWKHWQKQGLEFLAGAGFYLSVGAASAALFSLHQCAECFLVAIIRGALGYRINNHNLSRLLRITQLFTNDLYFLFDLDSDSGSKAFNILKDAYINVRYRDTYEPDIKIVATLYPVIKKLATLAECIYLQYSRLQVI